MRTNKALNDILRAVENFYEQKIEKLRFDRTYRAKVVSYDKTKSVAVVQINGNNYNINTKGSIYEPNTIVKVTAPMNNFSDMYINTPSKIKVGLGLKTDSTGTIQTNLKQNGGLKYDTAGAIEVAPKVGAGLKVDGNGVIQANVKVGNGLKIGSDGSIQIDMEQIVPVGTIRMWTSKTVPENYFYCDGRVCNKNEYPALFNILGYAFGGGGDTFNLPDLRSRFPYAINPSTEDINMKGGRITHSHRYGISFGEYYGTYHLTDLQAIHNIGLLDGANNSWRHPINTSTTYTNINTGYTTAVRETTMTRYECTSDTTADNHLPPYVGIGFIIKVK